MNAPKTFSLTLPHSTSLSEPSGVVQSTGVIVIIGANGSGKTRLGSWIDMNPVYVDHTHRISAQKSLTMPESTSTAAIEIAETELHYGHSQGKKNPVAYKKERRWGQRPDTFLLNDYEILLKYLFSDEAQESISYRIRSQAVETRLVPPKTKLDIVKQIWENILPHRELLIAGSKVEVQLKGLSNPVYNGAEMSDGERVIFYLIGQCLAAPKDGIIIIDEPELHLHKSIQAVLWDAIQAERPDCLFVYLTHDLDFATSRTGATKVWLRGFDGTNWDWKIVPDNDIPEDVFLSILGSRKPILFVEGDKSSLDYFLFSQLYPNFTVTPCGGCAQVIHTTKTFTTMKQFHNLECRGIIDQDYRSPSQVQMLQAQGVFVLPLSEVENLFLLEPVLRAVATELMKADIDGLIDKAKNLVFAEMAGNRERLISAITATAIESQFSLFNAKAQGVAGLTTSVQDVFNAIDVQAFYTTAAQEIDRIITTHDYDAALRIYNNKGLIPNIAPLYQMSGAGLIDYMKSLISNKHHQSIIGAMQQILPTIAV